jgi:hypothetical protein
MSDYLSGRELSLKIGISSYTESNLVLDVIGRTNLGITSVTSLSVTSPSNISGAQISGGIVTATKFVGDGSGLTGITASNIVGIISYALNSGVAYNVIGGIAAVTSLNVTGPSTISGAQISGGIVTATRFIGDGSGLTGISAGGIAGTITYAENAGVAYNVIGGIAAVTSLNVTGPSTISGAQISGGIVTATRFIGDGSGLTGISAGGIAGTITYAENAGFANSATTANYAQTAGTSAAAESLTGTPNITAGIVTATSFVGNLTGNANAATYAVISDTSTDVIGGIAAVTSLNVTGLSSISGAQISGGIVTATNFVGNLSGTAITARNIIGGVQGSILFQKSPGITTSLAPGLTGQVLITNGTGLDPYWAPLTSAAAVDLIGITIRDEGNVVGTASSITSVNFTGPNVVAFANPGSNGIATVTIADYVSVSGYSTIAGIATYAQNSGISTNVIGGIASVSSLRVSGISTLGLVQISTGIITAASGIVTYYGDGSKLTDVGAFSVVTQILTSNPTYPTYPTFASNIGVSSIGITTSGTNSFVFIPSTGFVGLGTTNPTSKIDVIGNLKLSAGSGIGTTTSAGPSLTFIGIATQFNYSGVANTNAVEIKAYARDNGTLIFNGYGNQILTLNDNFDDDLFVVSNYTPKPYSFIEYGGFRPTEFIEQSFRIDRAGNTIVGIGTSIRAKLDVRGSVILGVAHTAITTPFNVLAVSPQRINGDVTIFGPIRPRQPFSDLSNSPTTNHIIVSPTTGDTGSLNFYTGTASTTRIPDQILSLTNNVSGSLFSVNSPVVGFGSTTNLSIGSTITAIFEVNGNGNVGVGTSVPTSTLHVQGNATITGITTFGLEATSAPTINRTMSFELTNNNTLTVRVRGTDGLVRTGIIALVP